MSPPFTGLRKQAAGLAVHSLLGATAMADQQMLFCATCGTQLTGPLTIWSGKDPSVPKPEHEDLMPVTPAGIAYKSYEPIMRSVSGAPEIVLASMPVPVPLEFSPQFWINPDDLTEAVRQTKKKRRLQGCCGLDGCNGPNQICRCGSEIGTRQSDCWTPSVFIPQPEATFWQKIEEG
jgi:hypothetical protein